MLQSQALTADEGREVAEALVGALTAIHQKGMSHGRVEAASVLATEETVKLRSDCLHLSAAGQADDVAGIGTTLFHAFTQRKGLTATDAQINRIPAPFAEIIRNSFARRWTLAQVSNALKPALPVASVPSPPPPVPTPAPAPPPRVAALRFRRLRLGRQLRSAASTPRCSSAASACGATRAPCPQAARKYTADRRAADDSAYSGGQSGCKSMRKTSRSPSGARLPCTVRSLWWCWRFSDGC